MAAWRERPLADQPSAETSIERRRASVGKPLKNQGSPADLRCHDMYSIQATTSSARHSVRPPTQKEVPAPQQETDPIKRLEPPPLSKARSLLREWLLDGLTPFELHRVPREMREELAEHLRAKLAAAEIQGEFLPANKQAVREVSPGRSFALSAAAVEDLSSFVRLSASSTTNGRGLLPEDVGELLDGLYTCFTVLASLPEVGFRRPELTGEHILWWTRGHHVVLYRISREERSEDPRPRLVSEILRVLDCERELEEFLVENPRRAEVAG